MRVVNATALTPFSAWLAPGHQYSVDAGPVDLAGTILVERTLFERVGGYDEVFEGWGAEDVDLIVRLIAAGAVREAFPPQVFSVIHHNDERRIRHQSIRDGRLNASINSFTTAP